MASWEGSRVTAHTVAIIDDDAAVRKALGRLLRAAGFTVTPFASAEEFLAHSPGPTPDCLVLDVKLTGMSGVELRQVLLEDGVAIPIVFITAGDAPGTRATSPSTGRVTCLRKPLDRDTLVEAVRHAITPTAKG
jgi:two-component system, LuxR family, response regulator FixJ